MTDLEKQIEELQSKIKDRQAKGELIIGNCDWDSQQLQALYGQRYIDWLEKQSKKMKGV